MNSTGTTGNAPIYPFDYSGNLVRVWKFPLDASPGKYVELKKNLSPDEIDRASRYYFNQHRRRFIVARGTLRSILAGYLATAPREIKFRYSEFGKPALAQPDSVLRFNVSHSHQLGLVAIAHGREVGVDVEFQRPMPDMEQLLTANFSSREIKAFQFIPSRQRHDAFFACWTRKEAYIKAHGGGLSIPLNSFSVSMTPNEPAALLEVTPSEPNPVSWLMMELVVRSGYTAAVVGEGAGWRLDCIDWNL